VFFPLFLQPSQSKGPQTPTLLFHNHYDRASLTAMSASPHDPQEEGADKQSLDELEDTNHIVDADASTTAKRGRGRPKGSKNKKTTSSSTTEGPSVLSTGKKRGRPPKEKKEDDGTPPPKRPRGRPPKNPKPPATEGTSGEASEPSVKKRRGRPPKKTAT